MSRASLTKTCLNCGREYRKDPRNTRAYFERSKYCCQVCAGKAWSKIAACARPPIEDAFNRHFSRPVDGCWNWTGFKDKDGYGLLAYERRQYRAHVLALRLAGRPVPKGMYACHHCDNPSCVRPDHLYVGSPKQNVADAIKRGRITWRERSKKLTPNDVTAIRAASGRQTDIAETFGISRSLVSMIKARKVWGATP